MIRPRTAFRWGLVLLGLIAVGCGVDDALKTGIDGTGVHQTRDVIAYGRLGEADQIRVNDLTFDGSAAAITIDGVAGNFVDLGVGDILLVEGRQDLETGFYQALRVSAEPVLKGRVESIDVDAGSLRALKQTVLIVPETVFGSPLATLQDLNAGDAITVAGFRNVRGEIIATRVTLQTAPGTAPKTTGAITSVAADSFELDGLIVNHAGAELVPASAAPLLQRGAFVTVTGNYDEEPGQLQAVRVELRSARLAGNKTSAARIEGYVTALTTNDPRQFQVDGLTVATDEDTAHFGVLTTETKVRVYGSVSAGGAVLASSVSTGFVPPTSTPNRMTGKIIDASTLEPIAGVNVDAFVHLASGGGYSMTWFRGGNPMLSGPDGTFQFDVQANSRLLIYAYLDGYLQFCAAGQINSDAQKDFEILMATRTALAESAIAPAGVLRTLKGSVVDVSQGREPVPGAEIWVGNDMDQNYARTISDREGRFVVCNMPTENTTFTTVLAASKAGFADVVISEPPASGEIEVELHR